MRYIIFDIYIYIYIYIYILFIDLKNFKLCKQIILNVYNYLIIFIFYVELYFNTNNAIEAGMLNRPNWVDRDLKLSGKTLSSRITKLLRMTVIYGNPTWVFFA